MTLTFVLGCIQCNACLIVSNFFSSVNVHGKCEGEYISKYISKVSKMWVHNWEYFLSMYQ